MTTLEIIGTGGIIEGNLGDAIINVNQDAIYNFNPCLLYTSPSPRD